MSLKKTILMGAVTLSVFGVMNAIPQFSLVQPIKAEAAISLTPRNVELTPGSETTIHFQSGVSTPGTDQYGYLTLSPPSAIDHVEIVVDGKVLSTYGTEGKQAKINLGEDGDKVITLRAKVGATPQLLYYTFAYAPCKTCNVQNILSANKILISPLKPTISTDLSGEIVENEWKEFTVSTTNPGGIADMVRGHVMATGVDPSLIVVEYNEGGVWKTLPTDGYFGPASSGFPITEATSNFRVKATGGVGQTVDFIISLERLGSNTIIISTTGKIQIVAAKKDEEKATARDILETELAKYILCEGDKKALMQEIFDHALAKINMATAEDEITAIVAQAKNEMLVLGETCVPNPKPEPASPSARVVEGGVFSLPEVPGCDHLKPEGKAELFQIDSINDKATLHWTPVPGASGYAIYYGRGDSQWDQGDRHAVIVGHNSEGVNSFTINDLLIWSDYRFRIVPQNGCANGDSSNEMTTYKRGLRPTQKTVYFK